MAFPVPGETVVLKPVRSWWLRFIIVLAIAGIVSFGPIAWPKKAMFCAGMAFLFGTFPWTRINRARLERVSFVMFMPILVKRWSLDRFTHIETGLEDRSDLETYGWLFRGGWLTWRLLDFLLPWMGGDYKLWLRASSGKRVLAWQGNGESIFRENLELLEHRTGLPVERG
jgi:hypothetical protein